MLVLSSHVFFNVRSVNRIVENSVATSVIANLQFFPPLLFQIQDFTTRVRLQDYSIVFGDLHKNLTQRTIQQSFFFLQLINYSLF